MPDEKNYGYKPSTTAATDETGPYPVYGPHADNPGLVQAEEDPFAFQDNAVYGVTVLHPPIQAALRIRIGDIGKYIFGLWSDDTYAEYYLTSAKKPLQPLGRRGCKWLHEAFIVFETFDEAVGEGAKRAACDHWYAFSVSQISRIAEGIGLVRVHSDWLSEPEGGIPRLKKPLANTGAMAMRRARGLTPQEVILDRRNRGTGRWHSEENW